MQTMTVTTYKFSELSDKAKEKARDWYREGGFDYDWYDTVYEDAKAVAALMGIDIEKIYFSGFYSQGDGACFESNFGYKAGCLKAVKGYASEDTVLHSIAADWQALQKAHGYCLRGKTKHQGHYQHSQCTRVSVWREDRHGNTRYEFDTDDSYVRDNDEPGAEVTRILRRLMDWVYRQLEKEWEYLNADEQVDETIKANDYEFTAEGSRKVYL